MGTLRLAVATVVAAAAAAAALATVAIASATAAAAAGQTPSAAGGPRPTPKMMLVTRAGGRACIERWWPTHRRRDGSWAWADATTCCPSRPAPQTIVSYQKGRRCTSTRQVCGRRLNEAKECTWRWCTSNPPVCAEPVCPPKPAVMKTRWVTATGERCVKTWSACGRVLLRGKCTWKGCDVVKCAPPCPKPRAKTMKSQTYNRVCMEHWWPTRLSVDTSHDGMTCRWAWTDRRECWCRDGVKVAFKKC